MVEVAYPHSLAVLSVRLVIVVEWHEGHSAMREGTYVLCSGELDSITSVGGPPLARVVDDDALDALDALGPRVQTILCG